MATGRRSREDKGVVSLTYDGTLTEHAAIVFPQLEEAGLRATFYAEPAIMLDSIQVWRKAQAAGHDIGNGCLVGASLPDGSLPAWTPEMIAEDIDECDRLLLELFPAQTSLTFAYPHGEARCADHVDYRPVVERRHPVCRSGDTGVNDLHRPELARLKVWPVAVGDHKRMFETLEQAMDEPSWIVLAFESIDPVVHLALLDWLLAQAPRLTVSPVGGIATRFVATAQPKLRLI